MKQSIFSHIKRIIHDLLLKQKLKHLDYWYYRSLQRYILPHPPSAYYLHTLEELEQMEMESAERARMLLDELE